MPLNPIDYQKTILYKIVCRDLAVTDIYVGHTTNWNNRKGIHKSNGNKPFPKTINVKLYVTIRANGGWDNWEMVQIEEFPCKTRNEAAARERYWYETLNANLNMKNPNRSCKEYYQTPKSKEFYKQRGEDPEYREKERLNKIKYRLKKKQEKENLNPL